MTSGYIDDRDKLCMELLAVNTGTMWSVRLVLQGGSRFEDCFAGWGNRGCKAIQKHGQGREEEGGGGSFGNAFVTTKVFKRLTG